MLNLPQLACARVAWLAWACGLERTLAICQPLTFWEVFQQPPLAEGQAEAPGIVRLTTPARHPGLLAVALVAAHLPLEGPVGVEKA